MKISQLTQPATEVTQPAATESKLTLEQTRQLFSSPLTHLWWWDLLMALWTFAEDYHLDWAAGFCQHIIDVDIDWLRRAMHLTFQKLNAQHQQLLRDDFDAFLKMDKICDWKAMCRGHVYWAVVCTEKFPEVRLMRTVFAWSMAEAKSKFTSCPSEILLGWMRPGDSHYVPITQDRSDTGSLCLKSFFQ